MFDFRLEASTNSLDSHKRECFVFDKNKSATGISSDDAFVRLYFLFYESYSSYKLLFPDRAHYYHTIASRMQSTI